MDAFCPRLTLCALPVGPKSKIKKKCVRTDHSLSTIPDPHNLPQITMVRYCTLSFHFVYTLKAPLAVTFGNYFQYFLLFFNYCL